MNNPQFVVQLAAGTLTRHKQPMWPFSRRSILDAETARWHVDNMCWLLHHLAQTPIFQDTQLVLPAPGFFDTAGAQGHALAKAIFKKVKTYAGMADWPVELVSDAETYEPDTRYLVQAAPLHTPLGLFMRDRDSVVRIAYAPRLLKKPASLIATLAHELAHYVVTSIDDDLPCDEDQEEFLTDQVACFMGFGVFMANGAFEIEQWRDDGAGTQGWRTQRNGYLSEADLVFNLALFLTAKNLTAESARSCLKPHLSDLLKKAMREMPEYQAELQAAIAQARIS